MVYLNAASHGLPDKVVRARIRAYLDREDEIGPDAAEVEAAAELGKIAAMAARAINAPHVNVKLLGSTTIGLNAALRTLPLAGRRVLVAPGQWVSDVAVLKRMGADLDFVPMTPDGTIDLDKIAKELRSGIGAICIPQVSSLGGECYPVEEIGALPRPEGTFFVVDGAQGLGQQATDVSGMNCDIYAATTRKWVRGPRGTALVYVASHMFDQLVPNPSPRISGLSVQGGEVLDEDGIQRFDTGMLYAPQFLGLGAALKLFLDTSDTQFRTVEDLAAHARARAAEKGYRLARACKNHSAITTLRLPADKLPHIKQRLSDAKIVAALPSPDCEPLRSTAWSDSGFLRISPHVYNNRDDIDALFDAIQ